MLNPDGSITTPIGFRAATCAAGLRPKRKRDDLALIVCDVPATAAAVFTRNVVKAAPCLLSQQHVNRGKSQAIIVNSGNANCCTPDGAEIALGMCRHTANALGFASDEVLVASTGVIGQSLPLAPIAEAIPLLVKRLDKNNGIDVAKAIMTTDTYAKHASITANLAGKTITLGAVAKGSGMIHPNMGTMLAFVSTDATISASLLQEALQKAVDQSFNMVSVDGDTSTNDTVAILASGLADAPAITADSSEYDAFLQALSELLIHLAKAIAGDGEGAGHLIVCQVDGAQSPTDARLVAKSIVSSTLLKAAVHGADANWGRILCAAGYSGANFNPEKVSVDIASSAGQVTVCQDGKHLAFDEAQASEILAAKDITIAVHLNAGDDFAEAYGCDLTCDYVRINADYRS